MGSQVGRHETRRTLIVGYGNLDRQDDGAAYFVVNGLRDRLGQPPLAEDETGLEAPGGEVDSIFVTQLGPELLEIVAGYDRVVFVDAHVRPDAPDVGVEPIMAEYATATFTHHMTPAMLLALLAALHGVWPESYLVSVRGHAFDFQRGLTAETAALLEAAVDAVLEMLP